MISGRARTVALVHQARLFGHARFRRRPLPRQQHPTLLARDYGKALGALVSVEQVKSAFAPLLHELPHLLASAAAERGDALHLDAGQGQRIRSLVNQARDKLRAQVHPNSIDRLAQQFAERTSTFQRIQLNRQTKAALGVDIFHNDKGLAQRFEGFAAENVALITDLPERIAANVEKITTRALTTATLNTDLATQLDKEFGFGERRSELIARDQIGKLYGQVNAARQQDLGISRFIWRTSEDERVRPEHEDLDGQEFSYDDPPSEGLPGEPILCRCSAEPVFDGILAELSDDEGDAPEAPDTSTSVAVPSTYVPEPAPAPVPEPELVAEPISDAQLASKRVDFLAATTPDEQAAALYYSSHEFEKINGALRGVLPRSSFDESMVNKIEDTITHLDNALAKNPLTEPAITYRGTDPHESFMKLQPGQVFVDEAYLSTTTDRDKAFSGSVKFHITSPAGTKIGAIPSHYDNENEMLLGRSTALRVDRREKIGHIHHFYVTVVGQYE